MVKQYYAVLVRISPGYSPLTGRLHTCYSPVRRSPPKYCYLYAAPRLACVRPVASVHPEPGSNSSLYLFILLGWLLFIYLSFFSSLKINDSLIHWRGIIFPKILFLVFLYYIILFIYSFKDLLEFSLTLSANWCWWQNIKLTFDLLFCALTSGKMWAIDNS